MKIEVWSDFVCPFCYIGKSRLEHALNQFPHKDQVEVEFKSFELDPNAPDYNGKSIYEILAGKYGMSIEQAKQSCEGVGKQAASVGLNFNFDGMKTGNTFDAHRLAKFAKEHGKEAEISEKLLHAYFTDSKDVGNHETLLKIAEAVGLDRNETINTLQDKNAFANDVRIDEAIAQQYRVTGVPYFIINQKYAISGAQPTETFANALQKVWEEEAATPTFQDLSTESAEDASCVDGNCAMPNKE
ncbi:DsbA family oxidoreductase [Cytobacillus dafuensis]|uniref:DsbA family oxidoreductase n=1 Tax=Cytobacillus dafuensis TaxID=1742359 RepID=A0A5B8Z1I9_CYTDA|nr:DsbA family oxidoreductase [Cytobacillus dafuensis]QED46691.1 DsbA family oxidoreductase [Cytobacillus dafuensis]